MMKYPEYGRHLPFAGKPNEGFSDKDKERRRTLNV